MAATHCPYCALQCGMYIERDGVSWSVQPRNFPTNKGGHLPDGVDCGRLRA